MKISKMRIERPNLGDLEKKYRMRIEIPKMAVRTCSQNFILQY
ncbi:MAG: hypothetical protein ACE5HW_04490 [Candidatus Methanofastidiosia archaeon]